MNSQVAYAVFGLLVLAGIGFIGRMFLHRPKYRVDTKTRIRRWCLKCWQEQRRNAAGSWVPQGEIMDPDCTCHGDCE